MATGDREAILKLKAQTDYGKAQDDTAELRESTEGLGDAAASAADGAGQLADAVTQAGQAEDRAADSATGASQAFDDMRAAGASAGQDIAQGAGNAASAMDVLLSGTEEATALVAKLGETAQADIGRVTKAFREEAEQVAASTTRLDEQKRKLDELATQVAELGKRFAGVPGIPEAVATGLETVRTRVVAVESALQEQNAEVRNAASEFLKIKDSVVSSEQAATIAAGHVNEAWQRYRETLQLTPADVRKVAQAVEAYEAIVIQAHGTIDAASKEEIANLRVLQEQHTKLNAVANKQINAQRDNTIALQETGTQVASLANGTQNLVQLLDMQQITTTALVGKTGSLASLYQSLSSQAKTLNLNTLSATQTTAAFAAQLGALLLTVAGSIKAGKALSDTNAENAESWEDIAEAIKSVLPTLSEVKDRLGAVQSEIAKTAADDSAFENYLTLLTLGFNKIVKGEEAVRIALTEGREAVNVYYNLLNAGVSKLEASRVATDDSRKAVEAYTQAKQLGAAGIKIWDEAVRQSGGSADKLTAILPRTKAELDKLAIAQAAAAEAARKHKTALDEVVSAQAANQIAANKAVQGIAAVEQAYSGTTLAINTLLEPLARYIALGEEGTVNSGRLADALATVAANTQFGSEKERERIEVLIELAKNSAALTDTERQYAVELANSIKAAEAASGSARQRIADLANLKAAIDDVVSAVKDETSAEDDRTSAIQRAAAEATKLLASNRNVDASERARLLTIIELARQVDDLTKLQNRLVTQNEAEIESEQQLFIVKSGRIEEIQKDIDAKAEQIAALAREKTATDAVTTSTTALVKVIENGRAVYTNLTDAQRQQTQAMIDAGKASRDTADAFGNVFIAKLSDGRTVVVNSAEDVKRLNAEIEGIESRADRAAASLEKLYGSLNKVKEASAAAAGQ